jgi:hypothetical protein
MNQKTIDTILTYGAIIVIMGLFCWLILATINLRAQDLKHCIDMGYSYDTCVKNA